MSALASNDKAITGEATLKPPSIRSVDAGAHELGKSLKGFETNENLDSSENEDEHFSDASEGRHSEEIGRTSPIPTTRVEKVDGEPSYGEVPGTTAYDLRIEDAVPDNVKVESGMGPDTRGRPNSESPTIISGGPIPITVIEKVDLSTPSYGDVPGTQAHELRKADAVPDVVLKMPGPGAGPESDGISRSRSSSSAARGNQPIPTTKVSRIDSLPAHGEVPGTVAYEKRKSDAEPDVVEKTLDDDATGLPTSSNSRSAVQSHARRKSSGVKRQSMLSSPVDAPDSADRPELEEYDVDKDGGEGLDDFGDDFDDFEEGGEDDDFGDFDDGFQQDGASGDQGVEGGGFPISLQPPPVPTTASALRILNFGELDSPNAIEAAVTEAMNEIYPIDDGFEELSREGLKTEAVFLTERSRSLWQQLVAPPPLQPPNWVRSRIRRLFLVSLGVPVDLDEILPASKQKKLVLPSVHLYGDNSRSSPRPSSDHPTSSIARLKQGDNASSTSINGSVSQQGQHSARKRAGPPPPPELDISATQMLCSTTDAALANFTDEELSEHVRYLTALTERAGEVLEYWLKRKDGAMGNKEAFEGVIENLVKHARKVRK